LKKGNFYSLTDKPEDYLELWKYFTDDAQKVKDKMWTLATWLYTGLTALVGFAVDHSFVSSTNTSESGSIPHNELALLTCIVGIFMSAYSNFLLYMYGMHIRSAWNRADYLRRNIPGLSDVWLLGNEKAAAQDISMHSNSRKLPLVAIWLMIIASCYGILFVGILAIGNP